MNRIAQLEEFLREDPNDPFNGYALALEYLKTDQRKAYDLFNTLMQQHPSYLPTYYPFAHLLIELGEITAAEDVFKKGIGMATSEPKTLRELQGAYNDWLFDREV